MSQRFFSETRISGTQARLEGDEARHLTGVMRAKAGEELTLFDGSGAEFLARITKLGKHAVELEVVERCEVNREADCRVTLAVALPKGERQRWLVEKAVEIGVARLLPLNTQRGVAEANASALERMRRWVIEASKQCGRNQLMEIASPIDVENLAADPSNSLCLVADPGGVAIGEFTGAAANVLVAIGPEGGFSPDELQTMQDRGFRPLRLGPRILRIETAAIASAAHWLVR